MCFAPNFVITTCRECMYAQALSVIIRTVCGMPAAANAAAVRRRKPAQVEPFGAREAIGF